MRYPDKETIEFYFGRDVLPYWIFTSILALVASMTFAWWVGISLVGVLVIRFFEWVGKKIGDALSVREATKMMEKEKSKQ